MLYNIMKCKIKLALGTENQSTVPKTHWRASISSSLGHGVGCAVSWPWGYKTCFVFNSTEHESSTAHKKTKTPTNKETSCLSRSSVIFIMLINVKMPTIVGILIFMSKMNFVLS